MTLSHLLNKEVVTPLASGEIKTKYSFRYEFSGIQHKVKKMDPLELTRSYDRIAEQWARDMETSGYGLQMIERAVKFCSKKETALDVGCGSGGRVVNALVTHGFRVKGIDISDKMLQQARRLHCGVDFIKANIMDWETEERFDLVVAWDSIFHLPLAAHGPVLKKLCSFLQPGGILVYTLGDDTGEHSGMMYGQTLGYSSVGIVENLKILAESRCQCRHLELDQFPQKHVSLIARRME